jgi:two-component system, OmpR family, sensor kinase
MNQSAWWERLLPPLLAIAAIALILRISSLNTTNFWLASPDLIIILFGISLMVFVALTLALREVTVRLSQQSIRRAREDTLAEHRRFLRRLDHELKNPLTALHAGLSGLSISELDENQHQTVRTMQTEVLRLSQLVANLRKLAELEATSLELHPIDIRQFIDDALALNQENIESSQRRFELDTSALPGDLPPLTGDPDLLLLAVHNLLDNAVKYTQSGDTIRLQITLAENDLVIRVSDTGSGIQPEDQSLVWEELYRGSGTDQIPGTGIGLALVRAIVERHEGQVELSSQPGSGTIITLYLPHR